LGLLILANRLEGIEPVLQLVTEWWPLAITGIGLARLLRLLWQKGSLAPPLILIAAGDLLLLGLHDHGHPLLGLLVLPTALVTLGVLLQLMSSDAAEPPVVDHQLRHFVCWRWRQCLSGSLPSFRHGNITVIFGSVKLDLCEVDLGTGVAALDVTAAFGNVSIVVPAGWEVEESQPFLLGRKGLVSRPVAPSWIADRRESEASREPSRATPLLLVSVLGLFGDARVVRSDHRGVP
jgi:hypothetical protein